MRSVPHLSCGRWAFDYGPPNGFRAAFETYLTGKVVIVGPLGRSVILQETDMIAKKKA